VQLQLLQWLGLGRPQPQSSMRLPAPLVQPPAQTPEVSPHSLPIPRSSSSLLNEKYSSSFSMTHSSLSWNLNPTGITKWRPTKAKHEENSSHNSRHHIPPSFSPWQDDSQCFSKGPTLSVFLSAHLSPPTFAALFLSGAPF
jgi:hypothetical protein